jgi:outer membrane protein OmpA-like peptidoglycan-associated protein
VDTVDHNSMASLILAAPRRRFAAALRGAALAGGIALAGSACGSSAPTQQLVDARRTYNEASASDAARLTPDKLLDAQQALERAEAAHNDDPGSPQEAHLGYLAARKSAIAMAYGKIAAAKESEEQADATYQDNLRARAAANESELSSTQAALDTERQKRQEAEQRAASALKSLAEVAKVNEERRGTVITLPGGVLFPSGGHTLSPSARQSLDRVAQALGEQTSESRIVIEGHTDARGADDRNQQLSQQRAEAVRDYLVQKGVDAQRVAAIGKGEEAPIADNESAEGRATNRRVEIVVSAAQSERRAGEESSQVPPTVPGATVTPAAATPTAPPSAVTGQR